MVSIVIPAYNEEIALPGTLECVLGQAGQYEVLIVDGGSTDRTVAIAKSFGFRPPGTDREGLRAHRKSVVRPGFPTSTLGPQSSDLSPGRHLVLLSAPKGRASQMNTGAAHATGEWLLFLHADTLLPVGAVMQLNQLAVDPDIQAGGFLHRFSGADWRLRLISFLDNVRCARSRIIYGDQAMFVRRPLFERLGGFPAQPVLEDVAFGEKLLAMTTPVLLSPPVQTNARKFVKMGVWRSFLRVLLIILHVEFRLPMLPRAFFQDIR